MLVAIQHNILAILLFRDRSLLAVIHQLDHRRIGNVDFDVEKIHTLFVVLLTL